MKPYKIYKYTFPNGKVYIGMTKNPLKDRFNCGYKHNELLETAIKEYGWNGFEHDIIADNLTKEQAEELEIKYIKEYDATNHEKGYNISYGGSSTYKGLKHTEEYKRRLSQINKGRTVSIETRRKLSVANKGKLVGELNPNYKRPKREEEILKQYESHRHEMKKVSQYSLDGQKIATFDSVHQASKYSGVARNQIRLCAIGQTKHPKKYMWKYEVAE